MVVTRFAPSNTGFLHCGSARTALFSYAYAKAKGGTCILRIEDTDAKRSTKESLIDILSGLDWLGLKFDGGPTLQDAYNDNYSADWFQSKRNSIYNKYIEKLLVEGKAYEHEGAVMFRMPLKDWIVKDEILGDMEFKADQHKDFAIRKKDGNAVFHMSVVVDDYEMGVTHVIRGQDHISNTPKHMALQEALGFPTPSYAHIPLIMDERGAKLSKRRTDQCVLIKDFRTAGYLPDVIINYLALLGWSPGNNVEEFDLSYMIDHFDIKGIGTSNAKFDYKKLLNFNTNVILRMGDTEFCTHLAAFAAANHMDFIRGFNIKIGHNRFSDFAKLYHKRAKTLNDPFIAGKFFSQDIVFDDAAVDKILNKDNHQGILILDDIYDELLSIDVWTAENISKVINDFAVKRNVNMGKIAQPIRVAVTGSTVSPEIDRTLELLGRSNVLSLIMACVSKYRPMIGV